MAPFEISRNELRLRPRLDQAGLTGRLHFFGGGLAYNRFSN